MPGDNETHNKFTRAGEYFREWVSNGVLVSDEEESVYLYTQRVKLGQTEFTRRGFIAAVKLEDYESKVILPHEHTFPSHNADRLHLIHEMRQIQQNRLIPVNPNLKTVNQKCSKPLARLDCPACLRQLNLAHHK